MNKLEKLHEALKDNPELQRKVTEEATRLAESGEADEKDAIIQTVRENLGIEFTREELEPLFAKIQELDPEQMAQAAGGLNLDVFTKGSTIIPLAGTATAAGIGGAIGTIVCPVPVAGTFIGAFFGGVAGALISAPLGILYDD